jgi:hypothetical protein
MFVRKTTTRNKSTRDTYFTYRLVTSERAGKQVRQITLLNLGRHFELPQHDGPRLCARIEGLLGGQAAMLAEPEVIEALAQRFAARLVAARSDPATTNTSVTPETTFAEVDVASLQLIRPRSVGVEAVGLAAIAAGSASTPSCKTSASIPCSAPQWPPA